MRYERAQTRFEYCTQTCSYCAQINLERGMSVIADKSPLKTLFSIVSAHNTHSAITSLTYCTVLPHFARPHSMQSLYITQAFLQCLFWYSKYFWI